MLYRTWNLISVSAGGVGSKDLIEFTRQGKLLYGTAKTDGGCCNPYNFTANSDRVQFTTVGILPGICAQVSCRQTYLTAGMAWRIDKLDNRKLVLKTDGHELNFEVEP